MTNKSDNKQFFSEIEEYRSYWENNLQKIEEISGRIERNLVKLEKKYIGFEESYEELISSIDLLLSIYSSYNNLKGAEYLLKLKACLSSYKKKYTHEGIKFGMLYHLHSKVLELRNVGFADFPGFFRKQKNIAPTEELKIDFLISHRWITFQRFSSWFITPYEKLTIKDHREVDINTNRKDGFALLSFNNRQYPINILMMYSPGKKTERVNHYIIINYNGKEICYPAFSVGKRILAGMDVIGRGLKPYHGTNRKFIRMFGQKHIYIETDHSSAFPRK